MEITLTTKVSERSSSAISERSAAFLKRLGWGRLDKISGSWHTLTASLGDRSGTRLRIGMGYFPGFSQGRRLWLVSDSSRLGENGISRYSRAKGASMSRRSWLG